jgi:peptidoglycan/LPS O-acetylase OafA/YrhL
MNHSENNLTALRWFAAALVFYGHAFHFSSTAPSMPTFLGWVPLGPLGVYIFFAISGYLITQSFERDPNMLRFLLRRCLRIFPALLVCTALSVFVLGPVATSLPLGEYFRHPDAWRYFTNTFLYLTYFLPGVFTENHYPVAVNGSLWSLPVEVAMYLLLLIVGMLRLPRVGYIIILVIFALLVKLWVLQTKDLLVFYRTDLRQLPNCGIYFWMGAVFFKYDIKRYFTLTHVVLVLSIWICLLRWPDLFVMASWVALPFCVLSFGLSTGSFLSRFTKIDYSYGIYIYAFPIQQLFMQLWPKMNFCLYLVLSGVAILIFAGCSWHFIEKPALSLKPLSQNKLSAISTGR